MPLDEFELIDRFFSRLTGGDDSVICGIGDDAAVLAVPAGRELVVSTDTLVSGVHFFADVRPLDLGYKSLAVNLSDLAAMAAEPRWATLAVTVPAAEEDWLAAFARGFAKLAESFGVRLVGGDLTRGPLSITCQILGTVSAGAAIRRSGARQGDDIHVTGRLGQAALALALLQAGTAAAAIPTSCLERLLRPVPRVQAGLALRETVTAMIDISDGLAGDLGHILDASGAGAMVELDRLPCGDGEGVVSAEEMLRLSVIGGDDYELCFTAPAGERENIEALAAGMDCPITRIGKIVKGSGVTWVDKEGNAVDLIAESYHHF
ncbi:MAG: thiamine-phosphate kinase [Gammaproteobacteria bacterium]